MDNLLQPDLCILLYLRSIPRSSASGCDPQRMDASAEPTLLQQSFPRCLASYVARVFEGTACWRIRARQNFIGYFRDSLPKDLFIPTFPSKAWHSLPICYTYRCTVHLYRVNSFFLRKIRSNSYCDNIFHPAPILEKAIKVIAGMVWKQKDI